MQRERSKYDATLEARAYEYAIRSALRKCGLYLRRRSEAKLVCLRLPPDAEIDIYREAARALLKSTEALNHYFTTSIALGRRGETFSEDARDAVKMRSAVVVLIEHGTTMTSDFQLAFDRIVTVDPLRPAHLISAAREAWKMPIGRDQATALMKYPPILLFAALRRGRSVEVVLAKLAAVSSIGKPAKWEPKLEELEGYGEAKIWGSQSRVRHVRLAFRKDFLARRRQRPPAERTAGNGQDPLRIRAGTIVRGAFYRHLKCAVAGERPSWRHARGHARLVSRCSR